MSTSPVIKVHNLHTLHVLNLLEASLRCGMTTLLKSKRHYLSAHCVLVLGLTGKTADMLLEFAGKHSSACNVAE